MTDLMISPPSFAADAPSSETGTRARAPASSGW